jgi:hypothetical protein
MLRVHCAVSETTHTDPKNPAAAGDSKNLRGILFHRVTAAIATGKRPVPFRTRKLSLSAPMVLHSTGCGRVGHRRTPVPKGDPHCGSPFVFSYAENVPAQRFSRTDTSCSPVRRRTEEQPENQGRGAFGRATGRGRARVRRGAQPCDGQRLRPSRSGVTRVLTNFPSSSSSASPTNR